jgi:hypothetical protein
MAMNIRLTEFIWTAELAYVVGLMTTDGTLSPDGRHLTFTSKDRDQVELVKDLLGLSNKITTNTSTFKPGQTYWRIQFGNVALYKWFVSIGLMANKSNVLDAIKVPDSYFFDFLRGHLDGDGTIRVYNDPVYPNSRRLYTVFYAANRLHLEWLQSTIKRLINIEGYIDPGARIWRLTFAKTKSLKLLPCLYHRPDLPCLQRKKDRFAEFLNL